MQILPLTVRIVIFYEASVVCVEPQNGKTAPWPGGSLGSPSLLQSTGAQGSQGRHRQGVAGALTAL